MQFVLHESFCRPYASESSDSEADVFAATDARKLRMLAAVDKTEELKDYVLTAMRQLSRMSSGLAMLLPTSSLHQASHSTMDDTNPRGADLMGRVWHSLHKVSAAVNSLARHSTTGRDPYFEALDLTLLPPDPTMALEAIHAKLYALRHKLVAPLQKVDAAARPLLMSAWEQGHAASHEHAATAVTCWTTKAAELHVRVQAAIAETPRSDDNGTALLLRDVKDFLGTMRLIHAPALTAASVRQAQAVNELVAALQSSLPSSIAADVPHRHTPATWEMAKVPQASSNPSRRPSGSQNQSHGKDRLHTKDPTGSPRHYADMKKRKEAPSTDLFEHQQQTSHEKKARRPSTSPYAAWSLGHKERDVKKHDATSLPMAPTISSTAQQLAASALQASPSSSRRGRPAFHDASAALPGTPPTAASDDNVASIPSPTVSPSRVVGCEKCRMNNNHDKMLLCDNHCGREYHMYCLEPRLDVVPEDDWFCPECVKVACLAVKCNRFCVFNQRYCPRHLCKEKGCSYRCKKQGYCGKHSKLHVYEPTHRGGHVGGPTDAFDEDDDEYMASSKQ
ncbi:hypothetical protein, variant [Aphanomyces invadans]|uniref:PHD-type domain-containing protein n=1 Tax=Aphanomyces invadans TaxID=157072 RepID=A0A024TUT3_9STRA|nr:hypothetical protein, variant [Aphanomyces invadans]ETV97744.1 hypothetical protein, variant [Aphanomyces invadans]|eukprot:XP_008873305.1 hypothetical protein, variant [Aphanomyces invadans]